MMKNADDVKTWLCFFEQSGTFRDEFRKLKYVSFDYDIANDYGKTDYKVDLFSSLDDFDALRDLLPSGDSFGIFAFFPCTMFEVQAVMHLKCTAHQLIAAPQIDKARLSSSRCDELAFFYSRLCKLVEFCCLYDIPLIIENPYNAQGFLMRYFPFSPFYIDLDRRENGDRFVKPTAYWAFNFFPSNNVHFDDAIDYYPRKAVHKTSYGKERSEITSCYARRFIRSFLSNR